MHGYRGEVNMHRKQFSCFSIESLIGGGVDSHQQPGRTQVADAGDSSVEQRSSSFCRVSGYSSLAERTRTALGGRHVDDGTSSAEGDGCQQRTCLAMSLNDRRTSSIWSRCLPTVVAQNFLGTNDSPTSQFHTSEQHFQRGGCVWTRK